MADYRNLNPQFRAANASVVAISVDSMERSEAVRRELNLPFPILCDTERRVIQEWNIYNAREKGGIAKPAVFVIAQGGKVRYASIDEVATRVPASEILRVLQTGTEAQRVKRRVHIPSLAAWLRAIRNAFRP